MMDTIPHPLTQALSGGAGITMLQALTPEPDTTKTLMQVIVGLLSLLPTILTLFKRKTKKI